MAVGGGSAWSRRLAARTRTLRSLVRDTQRALHDVMDILHFDDEISETIQSIGGMSSRPTALVVLGVNPSARARLVHSLLGRRLLPEPMPRGCRGIRIQYGSSEQVHLTLTNSEFELVEELHCNRGPWDILPVEDLVRQKQTDLATILEVEINNAFLKDGLRIIIPPDIIDPGPSDYRTLKKNHSELYNKRDCLLKSFNPVYLYATDKIGKNIFSDNFCCRINASKSEEDFWTTYNLYYMARSNVSEYGDSTVRDCDDGGDKFEGPVDSWREKNEPYVFTAENCLDLHQIKEINPNSQVLFFLFSDSVDVNVTLEIERKREEIRQFRVEATESTEDAIFNTEELPESDQGLLKAGIFRPTQESPEHNRSWKDSRRLYEEQIAFMNELLDRWELMSSPPPKHYVKSQYVILDDSSIVQQDQGGLSHVLSAIQNANGNMSKSSPTVDSPRDNDKILKSRTNLLSKVVKFATDCLQSYLLEYCTKLSEVHVKLLQQFILASFDLARELQAVPAKVQYVARQEQLLYEAIHKKFCEGEKKQELLQIMQEVVREMATEVDAMDWSVDDLPCHQDRHFMVSNSTFYSARDSPDLSIQSPDPNAQDPDLDQSDAEEALSYDSYNFDEYEIINSNDESLSGNDYYKRNWAQAEEGSSVTSEAGNIHVETEWATSWSGHGHGASGPSCCVSAKRASLDVQHTVLSKLSRKISAKLVVFVDCLRDSYFGTLQRCVSSLERSCRRELRGRAASEAVLQLLAAARRVELRPHHTFSVFRTLVDSLRSLFHRLRVVGGAGGDEQCCLSAPWRRAVATQTLRSLSAHRLARVISAQILERLTSAHEKYQSALTSLESVLTNRLHHTEDVKLAIRKKHAPLFARLCLESTSMCDLLMYGMPELGREIGRGQYGVVYAARGGWAGRPAAAVKSVLPADDRHYHELAMEFFYTRSIPAHPRIVPLYGSIVQRAGGAAGPGPTVLLVSERKCRDLHAAVRAGLSFAARMRISCDIVEGIRYLHSLGLVHRDIKMKNVLLDASGRAALSDLGFCAAEALMSGSVVGTPVHMAPELLDGPYDGAVDVYAFGVLLWYVCAGNIKLPSAFETMQNKEQLWSKVKRGLRPERLPHFTDECWDIMQSCWASDPSQRALLGDVQPRLEDILRRALTEGEGAREGEGEGEGSRGADPAHLSDEDSLYMTGVGKNCL